MTVVKTSSGAMIIGIVMCRVFEEEIAHLIASDPEVSTVYVICDEESRDIERALNERGVMVKTVFSVSELPTTVKFDGDLHFAIKVLELWLHTHKRKLKSAVCREIGILKPHVNSMLVIYGLCGNALRDIDVVVRNEEIPIIMPREKDGDLVDDCVGMVLGGRGEYLKELRKEAGTWFMLPTLAKMDLNLIKGVLKAVGYTRVLALYNDFCREDYWRECEEFASAVGLRLESRKENLTLLKDAYEYAKIVTRRGRAVGLP
ncbi:MAG: hypothetical protein OD815_000416 [Candidatus Alkanophagales archaeon MCA70_species_2]|nr:hypothetical protein [Candidatus Alkanophaga liquidiphilum]